MDLNDAQILALALAEETCIRRRLQVENDSLRAEIDRLRNAGNVTVLERESRTDTEYPAAVQAGS